MILHLFGKQSKKKTMHNTKGLANDNSFIVTMASTQNSYW